MVDHLHQAPPTQPFVSPSGPDSDGPGALTEADGRYRAAMERAVRLLAQREHSVRELCDKLAARGVDVATASLVVDDLRGRGLQSDARFAEAFVHSRTARGQGPARIRRELGERGIDDSVADEVLTRPAGYWLDLAVRVRAKKFGAERPADRDAWNRQARFLATRGFPSDLIYRVLEGAEA